MTANNPFNVRVGQIWLDRANQRIGKPEMTRIFEVVEVFPHHAEVRNIEQFGEYKAGAQQRNRIGNLKSIDLKRFKDVINGYRLLHDPNPMRKVVPFGLWLRQADHAGKLEASGYKFHHPVQISIHEVDWSVLPETATIRQDGEVLIVNGRRYDKHELEITKKIVVCGCDPGQRYKFGVGDHS